MTRLESLHDQGHAARKRMMPIGMQSVWRAAEVTAKSTVAARQQQGLVAAFGQQLAPDQTASYNGCEYGQETYYQLEPQY